MFKKMKKEIAYANSAIKAVHHEASLAGQYAREATRSAHGAWNRLSNLENVLASAGLLSAHLYGVSEESAIDVAELEAMVHMLADHLGLDWVTVPETSSWERAVPLVTVVEHALGVLTNAAALMDANGVSHEATDAAMTELALAVETLCST